MKIILVLLKYFLWRAFGRHRGQGQRAPIGDVELYYELHGVSDGEPLLFLHGGGAFIDSFAGQIPYFARSGKYRLICVDSRAQGRSSDSEQPLSYALMAQDTVALLDHLQIERAHLIGWSDGGILGLHLGLYHPERLLKMVLVGANFNVEGLIPEATQALKTGEEKCIPSELVAYYKRISPDPRPEVLEEKIRRLWLTEPDYDLEQLASISTPTLVIHGAEEEFILLEHSQKLASALPNARLLVIPGATHAGLLEQPQKYNGVMHEFLSET